MEFAARNARACCEGDAARPKCTARNQLRGHATRVDTFAATVRELAKAIWQLQFASGARSAKRIQANAGEAVANVEVELLQSCEPRERRQSLVGEAIAAAQFELFESRCFAQVK